MITVGDSGRARTASKTSGGSIVRSGVSGLSTSGNSCHRGAPSGEICCHYASEAGGGTAACDYGATSDGVCEVGLAEYEADVVDALAELPWVWARA